MIEKIDPRAAPEPDKGPVKGHDKMSQGKNLSFRASCEDLPLTKPLRQSNDLSSRSSSYASSRSSRSFARKPISIHFSDDSPHSLLRMQLPARTAKIATSQQGSIIKNKLQKGISKWNGIRRPHPPRMQPDKKAKPSKNDFASYSE